jgi:hypothetical protein
LLARCGPGPGKEFVETIVGLEIDQTGEDIGEPSLRVDSRQFGCFDERGEDGLIFGAVIVSREESVLARQSLWAHWTLDDVGVELDAAIVEEARQAVPVPQPMANVLAVSEPPESRPSWCSKKLLRAPMIRRDLAWRAAARIGTGAAHVLLDGVDLRDARNGFDGDRRIAALAILKNSRDRDWAPLALTQLCGGENTAYF